MTIINFWLSPARAVLLTDTMMVNRQGVPNGAGSKIGVSLRLNAVSAARGSAWAHRQWAAWLDECETLDDAVTGSQACCREILRAWLEHSPDGPSAEFVTLGWYGSRCVGWLNLPDHDFRPVRLKDGTHCFPWLSGFPTPFRVPLLDVVRRQFAVGARLGISPDAGIAWTQATVTWRGVTTRILGTSTELGIRDSRPRFQYDAAGNRCTA
jgi:hypothetical protein